MAEPVKTRRAYRSPKRAAQAAATRQEIVEAGRRLFTARGYSATSIADIAAEAGVSAPTVKLVFGAKRNILVAVWDEAVKGDADERPVAEVGWYRELLETPDPRRQIELQVAASVTVKARTAALIGVIRAAALGDPEIAALWGTMQQEFYENQRATVRALRRKGGLRAGLTEREATDILWTLNHPTVYQLLTGERGWTSSRYSTWLTATLHDQLLP